MKTERQKDQSVVEQMRAENLARAGGFDVVDAGGCAPPVLAREMTNDAAVAAQRWLAGTARLAGAHGVTHEQEHLMRLGYENGYRSAATTVAELRAEVDRLQRELRDAESDIDTLAQHNIELQAAERRAEEAETVCRAVLGTFQRNLASEKACGQPFMGDDEHEAIRLLTKFLTKETPLRQEKPE